MKRGFAKAVHRLRLKDNDVLAVDVRAVDFDAIQNLSGRGLPKVYILFVRPNPGQSVKQCFHLRRT